MIQWYPGHMAKTVREINEQIKHIDIFVELIDARAPKSSQNPLLELSLQQKFKITVLMKRDLADEEITKKWLTYLKENDHIAIAMNVNEKRDMKAFIQLLHRTGEEILQKRVARGIKKSTLRMLIAGIPNVGKSTLINRLANKRIAKIGDRPGVTKQPQWIKVDKTFELLDTPGILWPKFEDEQIGMALAAIGSIKYELVPTQDVAAFVIQHLSSHYPEKLQARFGDLQLTDMWEVFQQIGKTRGALEKGAQVNMDKVAEIILHDFRTGRIGPSTLEFPPN